MSGSTRVAEVLVALHHEDYGRLLASLIRRCGDFDVAEEALQEAFARAWERWPAEGVPRQPAAWLTTVARMSSIDRLRRLRTQLRHADELRLRIEELEQTPEPEADDVTDERLRLIFTCCHPALAQEAQVALTLRTLCGLTTAEIARAFLTSEATLAQRLVRAKGKIRRAGIPYRVPAESELPERLPAVLAVIYLVFNEGYGASSGRLRVRADLCDEALRLGQLLCGLLPQIAEVQALLALMLLQDSRREARRGPDGVPVPLDEQDRSRWNRGKIEAARMALARSLSQVVPGSYALQALIAWEHARAGTAAETRWNRIVEYYDQLLVLQPTPVVALNRAAAIAMVRGPGAGLAAIDAIDDAGSLEGYAPYYVTRAELLRRLGAEQQAAELYRRALPLAGSDEERRFIERRLGAS